MSALVWTLPDTRRARHLGAAEIKAASRQFLTRALLIAACAHLMSIAGARVLSAWLARPVPLTRIEIVTTDFLHRSEPVPPPLERSMPRAAPRGAVRDGLPHVTPDEVRTAEGNAPVERIDDAPPGPPPSGGAEDIAPPSPERPPTPDEFVPFDEEPALVSMPKPAYPEMPRNMGIEGSVVVLALIGQNGEVRDAQIEKGKGSPLFNDAALAAVRRSTWKPALNNNVPVMVWVRIPINFRLN